MAPYVGEIRIFAGNFAPNGWMFCEGQTLPISENETLFQLIGTMYGGDGEETFNLPNLASRFPMHFGTGPDGVTYQQGEMAGTEQVTLTVQQIPNHSHPMLAANAASNSPNPLNSVPAVNNVVQFFSGDAPSSNMATNAITPVGGSQPHENMQPFLCVNFIISLFGVFPSQA